MRIEFLFTSFADHVFLVPVYDLQDINTNGPV
jgi:hypothetical protein